MEKTEKKVETKDDLSIVEKYSEKYLSRLSLALNSSPDPKEKAGYCRAPYSHLTKIS